MKNIYKKLAEKLLGFPIKKGIDKTRWCLLLGEYCRFECPHHYYRDFNGCCTQKYRRKRNDSKN